MLHVNYSSVGLGKQKNGLKKYRDLFFMFMINFLQPISPHSSIENEVHIEGATPSFPGPEIPRGWAVNKC